MLHKNVRINKCRRVSILRWMNFSTILIEFSNCHFLGDRILIISLFLNLRIMNKYLDMRHIVLSIVWKLKQYMYSEASCSFVIFNMNVHFILFFWLGRHSVLISSFSSVVILARFISLNYISSSIHTCIFVMIHYLYVIRNILNGYYECSMFNQMHVRTAYKRNGQNVQFIEWYKQCLVSIFI